MFGQKLYGVVMILASLTISGCGEIGADPADDEAPRIELRGDSNLTIQGGSSFADPGAVVRDNIDEDRDINATSGEVDTSRLGTYILTYAAEDNAGNRAEDVNRTVNVVDTTKPTITLKGESPMRVLQGSEFTDPGATVKDNVDPERTVTASSGEVDTSKVGEYTLTYTAKDQAGNDADSVTRTVKVIDTTKPTITLKGESPMRVSQGSTFTDPGATVKDNVDPERTVTASSGEVDTSKVGEYTLTYTAKDQAGNDADSVTRTVKVIDTTKPTITLKGESPMRVSQGSTFTDPGATIKDNVDPERTVTASSGEVDTSKVGEYTLTYTAKDQAGNDADSVTRTVKVVDTTKPTITLKGESPMRVSQGSTFTDPGATVKDNVDPERTVTASSGEVDTSKVGEYTLTYTAKDQAGNDADSVTRTVKVIDTTKPTITLKGESPMRVSQGSTFTDPGATVKDNVDPERTVTASSGEVDTSKVGEYTLTYTAKDQAGNDADSVTRIVEVIADTTKPTITLKGESPMVVEGGSTFTDPGATVKDNVDPERTVTASSGEVDTSKVGEYTLTYTAKDQAGNDADSVTRTVKVIDTTKPTITLKGESPMRVSQGSTFTDPGATVKDNVDPERTVTASSGEVDTSKVGEYTLTYTAKDQAGNDADSVTRTVKVIDTTKPTITLKGESPMRVSQGSTFTDPGATVKDNVDPERTVTASSGEVDTSKVGEYTLTYTAKDQAGNDADSVTRTVKVIDTTKPTITLKGESPMVVEGGSTFTDPGATVKDNVDPERTVTASSGEVDTSKVGEYTLTYTAKDQAGNDADSVTRTVKVVDTTKPTITLKGESPMRVSQGSTFTDPGATVKDNVDPERTVTASSGEVDTSKVGEYTLTYTAKDQAGNDADSVTRTVKVIDTTKPTITLKGESPMRVSQGSTFTDPGATVKDNVDPERTVTASSGEVDTSKVGEYTLTYTAKDQAGNDADSVERLVEVMEPLTITSSSTLSAPECQIGVATIESANEQGDVSYSIVGGEDKGKFDLNSTTGLLKFKREFVPDYDQKNSYYIIVKAADEEGQTATQEITVNITEWTTDHLGTTYGCVVSPYGDHRIWLDRNLGSEKICENYNDRSCYGDYYQWGRNKDGHEDGSSDTTRTLSSQVDPVDEALEGLYIIDSDEPYDWVKQDVDNRGETRQLLWRKTDGSSVCPAGYRVAKYAELRAELFDEGSAEIQKDSEEKEGNDDDRRTNAFNSFLKIPSPGGRKGKDGKLLYPGYGGGLWSSSAYKENRAYTAVFAEEEATGRRMGRNYGLSVRCIKD